MSAVKLTLNADETITVRVGRAVEHIEVFGKSHGELYDSIRWALISKGATFSEVTIAEELTRLRR